MDELSIVERLARSFGAPQPPSLGIGDDGALLAPSSARRALSVDASIEGVHFRRDFGSLEALAARAFEAAASDLAAMGARFEAALLSFELPSSFTEAELDSLAEGFARSAERAGGHIFGGNVSRGDRLALHTTVIGALLGEPLTRSGARPGDALFVSGPTGAAAAGLALLLEGRPERSPALVRAFLTPRARFDVAREITGRASAAIDLSDGLLLDLERLALASRVRAVVELPRLPTHEAEAALAGELDLTSLRLTGGESYELLVAGPPSLEGVAGLIRVGHLEEGEGLALLGERGCTLPIPEKRGHVHR